ncbi:uncharacterized protein FIBRA_08958 [Fibroporia radiculosa]|uniref:C2H2-type domain-containing protein n=1 Tax=Fibroporia radiculosa TaxID=599839 RepID=J4GIL2_9APHY|nr:uncharacterized protein FIBRA_08958 [Fibroporia radiculosa]CCM06673.1 predicted protein [Fibroporia radiculosa]
MDCLSSANGISMAYLYNLAHPDSTHRAAAPWDASLALNGTNNFHTHVHMQNLHWPALPVDLAHHVYPRAGGAPTQSPSTALPPDAQDFIGARLALFSDAPSRIRQWFYMLAHPAHTVRIEPALPSPPAYEYANTHNTFSASTAYDLYAFSSGTYSPETSSSPDSTSAPDALPWNTITPDAHTASLRCQWDGCMQRFETARFGDIEAHIRAAHFAPEEWDAERRGLCRWAGCNRDKTLFFKSFAKHIATRHLRSTATVCTVHGCEEHFTRADSRARHLLKVHGVGLDG